MQHRLFTAATFTNRWHHKFTAGICFRFFPKMNTIYFLSIWLRMETSMSLLPMRAETLLLCSQSSTQANRGMESDTQSHSRKQLEKESLVKIKLLKLKRSCMLAGCCIGSTKLNHGYSWWQHLSCSSTKHNTQALCSAPTHTWTSDCHCHQGGRHYGNFSRQLHIKQKRKQHHYTLCRLNWHTCKQPTHFSKFTKVSLFKIQVNK